MLTKILATGITLASLLVASASYGHLRLSAPKARHPQNSIGDPQKYGPCGVGGATDVRGTNVNVFAPGQEITVAWEETVAHPGHFRILFDRGGQSFPDPKSFTDYDAGGADKTLADNIPHAAAGTTKYSVKVRLPDVECEACTLQVLQIMTDKPPFGSGGGADFYYKCADMALRATTDSGVSDAVADSAPGGADSALATDSGTLDGAPSGDDTGMVDDGALPAADGSAGAGGGCSMAPSGAPAAALVMLPVFVAAALRRRRRVSWFAFRLHLRAAPISTKPIDRASSLATSTSKRRSTASRRAGRSPSCAPR